MQYAEKLLAACNLMRQTGDMVLFANNNPYWAGQINTGAALSAEMENKRNG